MSLADIIILVIIAFYTIVFVYFRLEHRVTILAALALLVATAITSMLEMQELAKQLANYAFYFLIAGVVLLFIRYIREDSEGSK